MATPKPVKRVPIELDKGRTMLLDWNAMYVIEERLTARRGGVWVSLSDLQDVTKLSIADMRTVIWGALVHEDESLTEHDVGKMVHMGNSAYVCEKLADAFSQEDEKDPAEDPPTTGDGKDPLAGTVG